MPTFDQRLEQFSQSANEAMDSLMALMTIAPPTTSEPAPILFRRYAELVQRIGNHAGDAGLEGLRSVCTLVETNLLILQDERRALTPVESSLLENWPLLLHGYLFNRADRASCDALLQNITAAWPLPLPEESVPLELKLLMRDETEPVAAPAEEPLTEAPAAAELSEIELPAVELPVPEAAEAEAAEPPVFMAFGAYLPESESLAIELPAVELPAFAAPMPEAQAAEPAAFAPFEAGPPATEPAAIELPAFELPAVELPVPEAPGAEAAEPPAFMAFGAYLPESESQAIELPAVELPAFAAPMPEVQAAELPAFAPFEAEPPAAEPVAIEQPAFESPVIELPVPAAPGAEAAEPPAFMAFGEEQSGSAFPESAFTGIALPAAEPTVAELPVAELPVAELPVAELPVAELPVAEPPGEGVMAEISTRLTETGQDAMPMAPFSLPDSQSPEEAPFVFEQAAIEPAPAADAEAAMTEPGVFAAAPEAAEEIPALPDALDDISHEPQHASREMLAMLEQELGNIRAELEATLAEAAHGTEDARLLALGNILEFLERLKVTVEAMGLGALAAFFTQASWHLALLSGGLSVQQQALLHQLPSLLSDYLSAPDDADACLALAALLADSAWPAPVSGEKVPAWQAALGNIQFDEASAQAMPQRNTTVAPEDISLALPEDVNQELLDGLLQELPVQVSTFTTGIARITGGAGDMNDAKHAMRAAHTLKGAANTVGIPGIANLTHQLEDVLEALIKAGELPRGAMSDMLVDAGDCLEAMNEYLLGLGPAPENTAEVLQQVLDCANRIDHEGVATVLGDMAALTTRRAPAVRDTIPVQAETQQFLAAAESPEDSQAAAASPAAPEQSLRVPAQLVDELLRLSGESLISNSQLQDHLQTSIFHSSTVRKQHQLLQQLLSDLETMVDIRGVSSQQGGARGSAFDSLEFEHYNELQTISRRLVEAATDAQEMANNADEQLAALEELLEDQQRLQMANQHALLRTRMVPISSMVPRLQRSVRQTSRLLDKLVEFSIKGEHTTMDGSMLNDLMDPLMHILRNSVDHGIETPDARIAAGKPEHGRIELAFARDGNSIVVRCRDDGAGLDYEAIRRIAENKGLIKPGHVHSDDELARLILMPGFSTREETSQVSGRGVGMDVVYSRVQELKGMLTLDSHQGKGLMVELRLPATLLSMHTLIIRQREKRLAVSTRGVEDIRYVMREQFLEVGNRQFFRDGEKLYVLLKLEDMLSMPHDRRAKDRHGFPVLLVRTDDGTERAILVQEILSSREIVMKKFGRYVPHVHGVSGAVILGDGTVAPVIDLVELLHAPEREALPGAAAQPGVLAQPEKKRKRALVVDDSLSARRAVVQVLKDADLEVRTANDGLDAVAILEKWIPDIIISDMEMPRMDGLELTSNIRHAQETRHIPVIMVTSRSTQKHRQMSAAAGVNVHIIKPFNDDTLVQHVLNLTRSPS